MPTLKPCPCGGKAELFSSSGDNWKDFTVECTTCTLNISMDKPTEEGVIAKWNNHPMHGKQELPKPIYRCPKCGSHKIYHVTNLLPPHDTYAFGYANYEIHLKCSSCNYAGRNHILKDSKLTSEILKEWEVDCPIRTVT